MFVVAVCRRWMRPKRVGKKQEMNHEKILIVEDEENERTGLAELVSSWGYRTETARTVLKGLKKRRSGVLPSLLPT